MCNKTEQRYEARPRNGIINCCKLMRWSVNRCGG
jgi:hypothetical protein